VESKKGSARIGVKNFIASSSYNVAGWGRWEDGEGGRVKWVKVKARRVEVSGSRYGLWRSPASSDQVVLSYVG